MRTVFAVTFLLLATCAARADAALDLVAAARAQVGVTLVYDPSYQRIAYPMGDVPMARGVCSDVVIWVLDNGRPHIGIVSDRRSEDGARPLMIHNIGWGAREEDVLFAYRVTGHFRAF